eukprot:CAMPEP_0115538370 /NCGR_PEP_ID=MMETSP0271-20121206/88846_1 /TAXON_ID=71861 /ORGANISM="Scrippsiella trochoidea, Strain CCMP3099" /LENGTH=63 /DNA_ID=CAMNT_0002971269 /DNA_START=62 /DNA_END=253 /DNA_ORIENTATION=+
MAADFATFVCEAEADCLECLRCWSPADAVWAMVPDVEGAPWSVSALVVVDFVNVDILTWVSSM